MVAYANGFYSLIVQYLLNNVKDEDRARNSFDYAKSHMLSSCKNEEFREWISLVEKTFEDRSILEK